MCRWRGTGCGWASCVVGAGVYLSAAQTRVAALGDVATLLAFEATHRAALWAVRAFWHQPWQHAALPSVPREPHTIVRNSRIRTA